MRATLLQSCEDTQLQSLQFVVSAARWKSITIHKNTTIKPSEGGGFNSVKKEQVRCSISQIVQSIYCYSS